MSKFRYSPIRSHQVYKSPERYLRMGTIYAPNYCREVESPLPQFDNLPDGYYSVRGDKKGHEKNYDCINGRWFIIEARTETHLEVDATMVKWNLLRSMSAREVAVLKAAFRFATTYWRWQFYAHQWRIELHAHNRQLKLNWFRRAKAKGLFPRYKIMKYE